MKTAFILLSLFFYSSSVKADYGYRSLCEVIEKSDFGAIGTIVKVDQNYFYLKVEKYILGKQPYDTLKIQKFIDWSCGKRYSTYQIGQKEAVFFSKSNYVISDFDFIGYGGGGEFELPIKSDSIFYNYTYNKLTSFPLSEFIKGLSDIEKFKELINNEKKEIENVEVNKFRMKSSIHNKLAECYMKYKEVKTLDLNKNTSIFIANIENKYLYINYENKVYVFGFNIDTIVVDVEDANVQKKENHFIINPKDAWTRRWVNIYSINDKKRQKVLFNQIFEIIELPEPRIYFGSFYRDCIYSLSDAFPRVAAFIDYMHENDNLKYELLSYKYKIKTKDSVEEFHIKTSRPTPELRDRISQIEIGDLISIEDVYVLYPDKTVKKIKGRIVPFAKYE